MSNWFRTTLRTSVALALIAAASSAAAAPYRWSFESSDGSNGGLISGSFVFDGTTYSAWDVVTSQNPLQQQTDQATAHYTNENSDLETFAGGVHLWDRRRVISGDTFRAASELILHFSPLLQDGNPVHGYLEETFRTPSDREEYRSGNFSLAGVPVAAPVPEPEAALMGLAGLALVAAAVARRRQPARP